jgi:membrane fusion protein (multidrug efflux system)
VRWTGAAVATVALALAAGCGGERPAEEAKLPPVTVSPVLLRDVEDRIVATGELITQNQAQIAAEVSGRVTEIVRDEGSSVAAGDVVLEIDPERRDMERKSARAGVAEAEASVIEQRRELARVRELFAKEIASKSQLDQAETALRTGESRLAAARARADLAERAVRDASVTAPFAGQVGRRSVARGDYVNVGQKLFELVAVDPIEVEFHVSERDSARVRPGQAVGVGVAPYPAERFEGTVSVIAPTIDPRTRTLRVRAQIANPAGRLRPGLFARVDLGVSQRAGVMLVPEEAILQRADGAVVFRVDGDGTAERVVIQTGRHHDGAVEVVSGLDPRDRVVTRGHTELSDGVRVAVQAADGAPTAVSSAPPTEARP